MTGNVEGTIGPPARTHQEQSPELRALAAALEEKGELVLPLRGASMGPAWAHADAVVVQARRLREPAWGDIVVFARADRWYAHRCLAVTPRGYLTKGDGRWAWDRPVAERDEVLGVVMMAMRGGRRISQAPRARLRASWELMCALLAWPWLGWMRRMRSNAVRAGDQSPP